MLFLITLSSRSNRRVSLHTHTPFLSYGASNFRDYIDCYVMMMISLWLIFDDDDVKWNVMVLMVSSWHFSATLLFAFMGAFDHDRLLGVVGELFTALVHRDAFIKAAGAVIVHLVLQAWKRASL